MPSSICFTPAYSIAFFIIEEISTMTTNAGSTTPKVAIKAPKNPPFVAPTNVAIFTARGPGVDSDMATRSISSPSVSQFCDNTISLIRDIIP